MVDLHAYELTNRYRDDAGTVFLSGAQALARLPFEQLRVDRSAGRNTAAYVTGYQGSPLAGFDGDARAVAALAAADGYHMVFQPAMNEELAATAVMGSQLASNLASSRYEGVIGIWYGKAPGLDRASDALRHAMFAGSSSTGGAVALVGDDPTAKSSTLPSSSDATLVDLHLPVFFPGDVQEAVDLGRHAIALSRASGLWSAIKIVESVADGTGTVELHPERIDPIIPVIEVDGRPFVPQATGRLVTPYTLEIEREFHHVKLELARQYAVENHVNTVAVRGPHDWIGIVASGSTYHEAREALRLLGLRTDQDCRDAGVRLLKLGLPVPLDRDLVRRFADGLAEVVVVEDKNPTIEMLVIEALYSAPDRPTVCGKRTPDGAPMLPATGSLDADTIAAHLHQRLRQRVDVQRLRDPSTTPAHTLIPLSVNRTPFFCPGCPHNTSTRVPDDALVGGGIGCHTMVVLMEPERFGHIVGVTAMGNEGAQWFGMAPFVDDPHLFQNMGDGTLFHSGMLAIRAAVANGVCITYKILYNGAVAMTGGQDAFGQLTVPKLAEVLLAEGVTAVVVTTEDPDRYRGVELPKGVQLLDRSRLIEAQERLRAMPGTTVLIHDQRCAAELRRDRKRGKIEAPPWRLVIDERVCEGCGDCGDVSNCLSVQPVETPYGRKTRIDQSSCNFDASCLKGDCPSFLTVTPARRARRGSSANRWTGSESVLPDPPAWDGSDDITIRLSGIGGTGVVTVSQILGTAAMLDGWQVRGLDQTGLSQKAGPVVSDIRLGRGTPQPSNRATAGSVDTLLAFDTLVAASDAHIRTLAPDRTVVVASSSTTGTGSMVVHPEQHYPHDEAIARLRTRSRDLHQYDARSATLAAFRDAAMANVYLLGVAFQLGRIPLAAASIERAIDLNGVAVEANVAAFRLGREHGRDRVTAPSPGDDSTTTESLADLRERLFADLVDYHSPAYAARFESVVAKVSACGDDELTRVVATNLHRLMAYKDEYEVARLLLRPDARRAAEAVGGPGAKVQWNLHPPMLKRLGLDHKLRLGSWSRPMLIALRHSRSVRGTAADPFGRHEVRRTERALVEEYVDALDHLIAAYDTEHAAELRAIAALPDMVRGYEDLKLRRAAAFRAELASRLATLAPAAPHPDLH